jgi:hypothetical protein
VGAAEGSALPVPLPLRVPLTEGSGDVLSNEEGERFALLLPVALLLTVAATVGVSKAGVSEVATEVEGCSEGVPPPTLAVAPLLLLPEGGAVGEVVTAAVVDAAGVREAAAGLPVASTEGAVVAVRATLPEAAPSRENDEAALALAAVELVGAPLSTPLPDGTPLPVDVPLAAALSLAAPEAVRSRHSPHQRTGRPRL